MKNEFVLAFNEVLEEKGLPKDIIVKALESAMVSAYRRAVNASNAQQVEAKIDLETGKVTVLADKEVVEQAQDPRTEVSLVEARHYNAMIEIGQMVMVESTPKDFGRVAAQTARQVIQQRIRDAERQAQLSFYDKQINEIVSGVIQAANAQGLTVALEMRAEGTMPRKEMIPGERFHVHDRLRALLSEVKDSPRGPQIILSRTHRNFLRRLLENEVPEIYHGIVEIRSIAREPGQRAKVAVYATQQGIDPVGACVGIRGVRIQAIVRELHDEKIDVIEWNADHALYIAKALSPARVLGVYLNEKNVGGKTATVVVPEDQLSLAIGRDGQNARLAAKLTGWRIDIKSLPEAASDIIARLQGDPNLTQLADLEKTNIELMQDCLARKAENRPLTPEEYDKMAAFVDRIEKRSSAKHAPEKKIEDSEHQAIRNSIPEAAFLQNLTDSDLSERLVSTLQENGFSTVGEVILQMKLDADQINRLQGVGPRAMQDINELIEQTLAAHPLIVEMPAAPEAAVIEKDIPADLDHPVSVDRAAQAKFEGLSVVSTEELKSEEGKPEPITAEMSADIIGQATLDAASVQPEAVLEDEAEPRFAEILSQHPEIVSDVTSSEEEESEADKKKKGKKKKGHHVEIEYDPEVDRTFVKKKHKRGDDGIDW